MLWFQCSASLVLILLTLIQIHWANLFVALFRRRWPNTDDSQLPHLGVALSLRGADPFLKDCLQGLMTQDYPSHEIRIVLDSQSDPALPVVEAVCNELSSKHVTVEFLDVCSDSCSLKNLALVQSISGMSDQCQAYVWLDSDTIPDRNWLRNMARPLINTDVGAVSGFRWYAPPEQTIANLVRHVWNAGASLQMMVFGIGWGGSFAIRRSIFDEGHIAEKWLQAMTEDTLASNVVLKSGCRIDFVSEATMVNCESTTFSACISFMTRQMQLLKFYHQCWPKVLWGGLLAGAALMSVIVLTTIAAIRLDPFRFTTGAATLLFATCAAIYLINRSERTISQQQGDRCKHIISSPVRLLMSIPSTLLIYSIALIRTYVVKHVRWRGIDYELRAGRSPLRRNYTPYATASDAHSTAGRSL